MKSTNAITKDVILSLAGVLGLLSIVWFSLAHIFSLSIVVVLTGSMAPGLPTGSAIVVEQGVPAADLLVGDIVTVPRPGYELPVTHRVVSIDDIAGDVTARSLTLQGDANATVDRTPYSVQTVQRAVMGLPTLGYVIRTLQSPLFTGAATLLIALAIVWAFWPPSAKRVVATAGPRRESIDSSTER
ncbi:signal peptidase I [Cryobacterium serini]|uniref:signal peptidase I n=1 Tax=Cryobacterium serini TaxID=1259201 RepID=UPI00141A826A|nr:signal peptidase I [Cryobacterium serini]